ncbi:unnamed protein product [Brassica oleracea]
MAVESSPPSATDFAFSTINVLGKPVHFDAIWEVDIYKHEPWDLAGLLGFFVSFFCLRICMIWFLW